MGREFRGIFFLWGLVEWIFSSGEGIRRKLHPHDFISEQNNPHQNQVCRYFR